MNNQTKFVYDRIIKNDKIKSILNIGFRHDSDLTLLNHAYAENKKWKVIEIYKPNVDNMIKLGINATCMDVLNIDQLEETYDAIIWLHGPEHITWDQFLDVRKKIEAKSNHITIYQAPIGEYPQDELYGNVYEKHVSVLYPEQFEELGYEIFDHTPEGEKTFSAWTEK